MIYQRVIIHGETEGTPDNKGRFLEVRTRRPDTVVIYAEGADHDGLFVEPEDALALIAALTEAVADVLRYQAEKKARTEQS